ncbi:MAG: hypothetical protein IKY18_00025 [Oscillospiraceae bacterium]|nr:hypothetical protein [Oscillospiraceae bacterium]
MSEYIQALKSLAQSNPINCADGDSVLALLYEAYSGTHPLQDTAIKQAFADLYQAMNGMALPEMDQILYPICTLRRTHERSGFEAGVKLGIRLAQELVESNT